MKGRAVFLSRALACVALGAFAAALASLTHPAAAADTDYSANYFLPACKNFINQKFTVDPLRQGQCKPHEPVHQMKSPLTR